MIRKEDAVIVLHVQLFAAPAQADNGTKVGCTHRLDNRGKGFAHVAADHGAKADVNRFVSLCKKSCQCRIRLIIARLVIPPEAGHMDMLPPPPGSGHYQRTNGVDHGDGVPLQRIVRLGADLPHGKTLRLSPIRQVALFQQTDQEIAQLVAGQVPALALVQPGRRGNRRYPVGIHGEVLGLNTGNVVFLRNGVEHGAKEGAAHGIGTIDGLHQIIQQSREDVLQALLHLIQKACAVYTGLHQVAHYLHHVPGQGKKMQSGFFCHFTERGKGGYGNLMPPLFQFFSQQHIRPHIAHGTNGQHGDSHSFTSFTSVVFR